MNIDKYYLVSIDRTANIRKENITKLKQSVKEYTGKNIYKFGVDGKKLNGHIVKGLKRRKILHKKDWGRTKNKSKRSYTYFKKSIIGCFLSHVEIWEDIIKNNIKYAIIFEDDALYTTNNFFKEVDKIISTIPENTDFISLFHHNKLEQVELIQTLKEYNEYLLKINDFIWGTVCYIITLKGAKKFMKNLLPIDMPVDGAIAHYCLTNKTETAYLSKIKLVKLCDNFSTIRVLNKI